MASDLRVCALSDQHGHLPDVPPCDLLIIAGDICPATNHDPEFQAEWLDGPFRKWLDALPAQYIVGIAGNHDWIFQLRPDSAPELHWNYLQDSSVEVNGLLVYGSPWQPRFCDWAFNAEPDFLRERWALIPDAVDILVTHGPPYGIGDVVLEGKGVKHAGCPELLARLKELPRCRLHVCGHIHDGAGEYRAGKTRVVNASLLDERYQLVRKPWEGTC